MLTHWKCPGCEHTCEVDTAELTRGAPYCEKCTTPIMMEPDDAGDNLATAIRNISRGVDKLSQQGLNRRAIEILLVDATNVRITAIREVLNGIATLEKRYCTPPTKSKGQGRHASTKSR